MGLFLMIAFVQLPPNNCLRVCVYVYVCLLLLVILLYVFTELCATILLNGSHVFVDWFVTYKFTFCQLFNFLKEPKTFAVAFATAAVGNASMFHPSLSLSLSHFLFIGPLGSITATYINTHTYTHTNNVCSLLFASY